MDKQTYNLPIILSVALHAVIIVLLIFVPLNNSMPTMGQSAKPEQIVQAVSVSQQAVAQEVQQIKQQQQAKQQAEQEKQRAAKEQLAKVQRQREQEQARLKKMQAEQKKVADQIAYQKQEQARLKKVAAEKAKQEKIREQKLAEQKKQAAAKKADEEKQLAEKERQQELKKKQLAEKLKQEQADLLKQQMEAEQKALKAAQAKAQQQAMLSEIDKYKGLILQAISQNWLVPSDVNRNLSCQLLISLGPGGTVLNVQVARSSGNTALDNSAKTAVYKSSPLPVPSDPALFNQFRQLKLTVRPENVISG